METEIGTLYIVATPIGNLGDFSARAKEILDSVDIIYCEDTRVTKKLLTAFEITTKTAIYHEHSTDKTIKEIYKILLEGKDIALVTDAGTPAISDPGGRAVEQLYVYANKDGIADKLTVSPIPGPSAVVSALSVSGFPCQIYTFLGFPPHKKGRQTFFENLGMRSETQVFFESSHRIEKAIISMAEVFDEDRQVVICRELTKKFETTYRGTISEIANMKISIKGEFVIVVRQK